MDLEGKVAVVTGAGSGIGLAVCKELSAKGMFLVMVDRADSVRAEAVKLPRTSVYVGDVCDAAFRSRVFTTLCESYGGPPSVLVPAAGITRDYLGVRVDKSTGQATLYSLDDFRDVISVNLQAPTYWAMELAGKIAEARAKAGKKRWSYAEGIQAVVVFIGSVASRGNVGQISYSATKAGIEAVAATLGKEGIFHGLRCVVVQPGFTDTPMVAKISQEYLDTKVIPTVQQRRLIQPDEIAKTIAMMAEIDAITGTVVADGGWFPLPA